MRFHLRFGRRGLVLAMAITAGLVAPRRSSADVITIDDGGSPGTTDIPFTCSAGLDNTWLPFMGFVYRDVEAFELAPGDTIAFDIQMRAGDPPDLGFLPQLDLALAYAPDPLDPFKPDDLPGSDFATIAHDAIAASPGNGIIEDYELAFTVDTRFEFPGGGLIIRVGDPMGALATRGDLDCLPVITADRQPTGTNRLVGTFKRETGEYPWVVENTTNTPNVPYVRIAWTRCGDGRVSGTEACDDGNADNTDDCTNTCLVAACGDGVVQLSRRVRQLRRSRSTRSVLRRHLSHGRVRQGLRLRCRRRCRAGGSAGDPRVRVRAAPAGRLRGGPDRRLLGGLGARADEDRRLPRRSLRDGAVGGRRPGDPGPERAPAPGVERECHARLHQYHSPRGAAAELRRRLSTWSVRACRRISISPWDFASASRSMWPCRSRWRSRPSPASPPASC